MLCVDTLQQLFLAAETLTRFRTNPYEELTILSNSGGAGVMAADAASHAGVKLADLGEDTLRRLDAVLPLAHRALPRLIACWLGEAAVARARQTFQDSGSACYPTPEAMSPLNVEISPRPSPGRPPESWRGGCPGSGTSPDSCPSSGWRRRGSD